MSDSYVGKVQGTPTLTTGQMSHLNLDTNGNLLVNIAQGSFSSTAGAQYNAAQQNFSNGTTNPLQADSHGQLLVNAGGSLSTPLRTDPVGTTTQPVSGTVSVSNFPASQAVSGTVSVSGTVPVSGTFWQATQPVSGTVGISGTVPVSGTFWQATQPVSIAATVNTSSLPTTAGGLSSVKVISAASNNATLVKSTAGQVYNIQAFNTATSVRYLKLYNKTTAPAPATDTGSTVLLATYLIPANGSGLVVEISNGLAFSAGIGLAIVTGIADSDNTSTGASEVVCNLQFK